MNYTDNFNLKLPEKTDLVDIADFNYNFSAIDTELKDLSDATAAIPTMESAITNNTGDIGDLTTRIGTDESNIAANTNAINGLDTRLDTAEDNIAASATSITNIEAAVTDLETKQGTVIQYASGSYIQNPTVKKIINMVGECGVSYNGNIYLTVRPSDLPANFTNFYVKADIYCNSSNSGLRNTFIFNRAFISDTGSLSVEFVPLKDYFVINDTDTYDHTMEPSVNNMRFNMEVIFI